MLFRDSNGIGCCASSARRLTLVVMLAVYTLMLGLGTSGSAVAASGGSSGANVVQAVPLVTRVILYQPTCRSSRPAMLVRTSTDLIIKYRTKAGTLLGSDAEQPAGLRVVALPVMGRGRTVSYFLVVQVLDGPQRVYGPYTFRRLSNTKCLVRATQPTRTVANPKVLVHLESGASFGYKSRTGAIHWVRGEAAKGWYPITLPAMRWGASATWYLVLSFTDDSAKQLILGPLVFHRV